MHDGATPEWITVAYWPGPFPWSIRSSFTMGSWELIIYCFCFLILFAGSNTSSCPGSSRISFAEVEGSLEAEASRECEGGDTLPSQWQLAIFPIIEPIRMRLDIPLECILSRRIYMPFRLEFIKQAENPQTLNSHFEIFLRVLEFLNKSKISPPLSICITNMMFPR